MERLAMTGLNFQSDPLRSQKLTVCLWSYGVDGDLGDLVLCL